MPYPTTPATWVAGDVLTAAQLNAQLRDALLGAFPLGPPDVAWTAYTPALLQSGAVTKSVPYARYMRVGRFVNTNIRLDVTATGAGLAANPITVSLPVAAATIGLVVGSGYVYDASAGLTYPAVVEIRAGATTVHFIPTNVNTGGTLGSAQMTAVLTNLDVVSLSATYEAAT